MFGLFLNFWYVPWLLHVVMEAIQHLMQNCTPETPVTSSRELEELQEEVAMCIVNLTLFKHFILSAQAAVFLLKQLLPSQAILIV